MILTIAESFKLALEESDTIFCCIGTTQKNVKGDNNLYRKIDYDIPLKAARFGKEIGCEKFIIITAVGADTHSSTFYLKLKGELENAIGSLGYSDRTYSSAFYAVGRTQRKTNRRKIITRVNEIDFRLIFWFLAKI